MFIRLHGSIFSVPTNLRQIISMSLKNSQPLMRTNPSKIADYSKLFRGRPQLIVQFVSVGISGILDHGLTYLIAALKVHAAWWWPLVDLLGVPHSGPHG